MKECVYLNPFARSCQRIWAVRHRTGCVIVLLGFDTLTTRSDSLGMIALQAFSTAIVVSVFANLFPHAVQTQNGMVSNDGLGIVQSFYLPKNVLLSGAGATFDPEREEWQGYEADWWKRG